MEALIYLAVVSLLVGTVGALISLTNRSIARENVREEVEEQGRLALETITRTVRNASAINAPAAGATAASLSVNVDVGAQSPTVFSLSGGAIQAAEGAGAAVPVTNTNVTATALSFQNLTRASTPGTVRVSFVLSSLVTTGTGPFVYTQTFYGSASLQ